MIVIILLLCNGCLRNKTITEEFKCLNIISNPNIFFDDSNLTITDSDGGSAYQFQVSNPTMEEYSKYVEQTKSNGFDNIVYEYDKSFAAYDNKKLIYIEINFDEELGYMYVSCQKAKQ